MRDSAFKRILLSAYFSAHEILNAAGGMFSQPEFRIQEIDYDRYWRNRSRGGIHPRFEIIGRQVQPRENVLDVGCGDGAMLEFFSRAKGATGVGLDISPVAVQLAKDRGVDARAQTLAEFCEPLGHATFDHVVVSEVLEHVVEPERILAQAWNLTSKSLWLTFPNIAYFPHRLRLLAGRFPVQWVIFPAEHVRFWSIPDFRFWLKQMRMPEPTMYVSNGLTIFGLHKIWPNLLGNQIVVQLRKDKLLARNLPSY